MEVALSQSFCGDFFFFNHSNRNYFSQYKSCGQAQALVKDLLNQECNTTGQWKSGANILNFPKRTEVEEKHQLSRGTLAKIIGQSGGQWEKLSQDMAVQKEETFK